ncbi:MAG: DUF2510 domain-containing protein [Coriobacteriales bacterium]|nr:DUF2510 domain-containing protein [Coriobacteriales bacterium]
MESLGFASPDEGEFSMADGQIPAGWYPDPAGDTSKIRYWDGQAWTDQTQPTVNPSLQVGGASTAAEVNLGAGTSAGFGSPSDAGASVGTGVNPYGTPNAGGNLYPDGAGGTGGNEPYAPSASVAPGSVYVQNQDVSVYATEQPPSNNRKGFAIASLIVGILGILICCLMWVALIPGALAVIFGALGLKSDKKGIAIAGIICGVLALLLGIFMTTVGLMIIANPTQYGLPADYFSQFNL